MTPLVFPFKTALGYYFYETQRNEIVSVDEYLYSYIKAIIDGDNDGVKSASTEAVRQYEELISLGYLAAPHIKKIKHGASHSLEELLNRRLDRIVLQVTQKCNLRCSYCIYSENSNLGTRSHSNCSMDIETAKKAVDFYFQRSIDNDMPAIAFYGGEPLLEYELIRETVDYAKQVFSGRSLIFAITTNATMMSDEVIDFLVENKFSTTVSMDGPKNIHDKNRKFANGAGSYDTLIKNLVKLKSRSNDDHPITINMVVDTHNNYDEIASIFDYPELSGVNLSYSFIEEDGNILPAQKDYLQKENYCTFLGLLSYFRENKKNYPNRLVEYDMRLVESSNERFRPIHLFDVAAPGGPCIPGKMRLFVDYKGSLFPCERVSETSTCMEIGSLSKGFDLKKIGNLLNVGQLTEEKCKSCWAFSLCSVCGKYAENGDILCAKKKVERCGLAKNLAFGKISRITLAYENDVHEKRMCETGNKEDAV